MATRYPTHAGSWYPSSKSKLKSDLERWLDDAHPIDQRQADRSQSPTLPVCLPVNNCRAIIAPHAGYSYSGPAAAWAYKTINPSQIKRVFVLGPSHHLYLENCALSNCLEYQTPLGNLPIDQTINLQLKSTGLFSEMSLTTDQDEHSIELHLPYIRQVFKDQNITLVPILVGSISSAQELEYGNLLAPYLANQENFFVISSDFCHWGTRFSYTYYVDPRSGDHPIRLNSSSSPQYPIYKSIENLDRLAMEAISLSDPKEAHQTFTTYLKQTKNTICGRHPIGVLLGCLINLENKNSDQQLRFVRYEQSSQCLEGRDSSVSYASAFLSFSI
ncbi:hypothetical protein O181_043903 [Austropuccinia psidii MF-1]|uniref:Uncharacterized protein n=1 Tax=Austropuccinia psidii MF-1 TaxID=1389203 RepID=A0A9Q3HG57_9BASI|nr:hypothetical protein [Austropuccinia psidii MF-1]